MPSKPKKNKKKTKNGMSLRQSKTKKQKQIHLTTLATRNKSWGLGKHTLQKIESVWCSLSECKMLKTFRELLIA